ncbi:MAG: CsgG/HfaB family protein [candidate division Zixibacteria bacterium]|nr:CsgG/HfaB family protein [candidate division Zixibacteria bacterium]
MGRRKRSLPFHFSEKFRGWSKAVLIFGILYNITVLEIYAQTDTTKPVERTQAATIAQKVDELSQQIYESVLELQNKKIAVLPLYTLTGRSTEFGLFIADKLTNALFKYKDKFEVVDRMHLKQILKEQKLGQSGEIDPATAQQLGKVLGAGAIVAGSYTDLGSDVDVTIRVLSTEQGKVVAVASVQFIKDASIERLLGNQAQENSSPQSSATQSETTKNIPKPVTPSNMEIIIPATEQELSTWQIEGGKWVIEQDILPNGEQGNVISQRSFNLKSLAFFGNPASANYTLEFIVKIIDIDQQQPGENNFKIYLRARDKDNNYFLKIYQQSLNWSTIVSQVDGVTRDITTMYGYFEQVGKWYYVKIALLGNTLQYYVDDKLVIEQQGIGAGMGMLGFETSGMKVSIANIKIRPKSSTAIPKPKGK